MPVHDHDRRRRAAAQGARRPPRAARGGRRDRQADRARRCATPSRPGRSRTALSGTPIGHALHPLLTDLPIGTWTSALLLDALGGSDAEGGRRPADRGRASRARCRPSATGLTEWADSEAGSPAARRVGLLHAATNLAATALFGASLAARRGGARGRGKLLALAGAGALGAGGWLGGHLSYAQGLGVDRTAFEAGPEDWTEALPRRGAPRGRACAASRPAASTC